MDLVYDILNVAYALGGAYDNYGKKPDIQRKNVDNLMFVEPGDLGLRLTNLAGAISQDHQAQSLFSRFGVFLAIREESTSQRDNLLEDVKELFKSNPVAINGIDYVEIYPNSYEIDMTLTILN